MGIRSLDFRYVRKHMVNCRLYAWAESTWPTVGVVDRRGQHKTQYLWPVLSIWSKVKPVFLPRLTVWLYLQFAQMPIHLKIWRFSWRQQTDKPIAFKVQSSKFMIVAPEGYQYVHTRTCTHKHNDIQRKYHEWGKTIHDRLDSLWHHEQKRCIKEYMARATQQHQKFFLYSYMITQNLKQGEETSREELANQMMGRLIHDTSS